MSYLYIKQGIYLYNIVATTKPKKATTRYFKSVTGEIINIIYTPLKTHMCFLGKNIHLRK